MTTSSHLSIPLGRRLYSFTPAEGMGEEPWYLFLESEAQAIEVAKNNGVAQARNEVSGLVVFKAP